LESFKSGEEAQSSLIRFQEGDILFGAMRPYFHKVCLAPFSGTTRTTCFVLMPRAESDGAFALMLASEESTVQFATTHSVGSTIPYAKWQNSLREMPCILSPENFRAAFGALADKLLQLSNQGVAESSKLAALRDYLLPRLLSGRVRVVKTQAEEGMS
jgi:type I restriction enzyme S subunit